jgi:hypothetical protein
MKARFGVTASPMASFNMLLNRPGPADDLLEAYIAFHDSGRALFSACHGLELDPGTWIWMPALNCGVEAQAAIDGGSTSVSIVSLTNCRSMKRISKRT